MLLPLLLTGAFFIRDSTTFGIANDSSAKILLVNVLQNDWFAYGLFPFILVNAGLWSTIFVSDIFTMCCGPTKQIEYGQKSRASRLEETETKISRKSQIMNTLTTFGILLVGFNSFVTKYFFQYFVTPPQTALPDLKMYLTEFTAMLVVFDFILYWWHRIEHNRGRLWNHHKIHHAIQTPTAVYGSLTSILDEIVTANIVYLAALFVQPHPVPFAFACGGIVSEFAALHSGLDSGWFDFITLRHLPGRSSNRMHDFHHQYGNKMGGKNFGHFLWIWDYAFGTLAAKY